MTDEKANDPIPFANTGAYDVEGGQILDVQLVDATSGNEFAKMSTDVDSIACHSSKLEDLFDAMGSVYLSVGFDCIINRETFVTKSPFTVKCAPRSDPLGYHPQYRGNKRNTIPLKYYPNLRLCVFQKNNIPFFLSVYVLRTVGLSGPRMDRLELAVISCVLNVVRQSYHTLSHWDDIKVGHKASLARAFKSWAPFMVKSGPTQEQKGLKNRVNGLSGLAAGNFPFLFMDALRLIANSDWGGVDYRDFLMHRNKTITTQPTKPQFRTEATCLLTDLFFSVQAVGFKDNWPRIAEEIQKERHLDPPTMVDIVNTRNKLGLTILMNQRIVEARQMALHALFRPISARNDTCHFYSMDVGVSFAPLHRNTTFVYDGYAVNHLVKNQMAVKWNDELDTSNAIGHAADDRPWVEDYSSYDANSEEWTRITESVSDDASILGHSVDSDDEALLDEPPFTQRLRGGGDVGTQREGNDNQNADLDLEGLNAILEAFDGQLIEHDRTSINEEETGEQHDLNEIPDMLEAVEDRQRPYRIQYPLFGTSGAIGNAQQQTNFIHPIYKVENEGTAQHIRHYVSPYIPLNGRNKITGMKTYMDSSRTMFQRWTHQATHSKLKYLGIQIAHFLKSSAQQRDNSCTMPQEMKDLIQNMDYIYQSFLDDFRSQDRCSVRSEYTFMGTDCELGSNFDTLVHEDLCPLSAVKELKHSELYKSCKVIYQQNVRPLLRLSHLSVEVINQVYTPSMKTALVARAEASAHFLQCGGIVQGSLHNRILSECESLFLQVPTRYHVQLSSDEQATSLLAFGVQPGLLALLSDQFLRTHPRSCLYRMDASLVANISRNAPDLIRSRDELLETLHLSVPNTSPDEIGSMTELPFLLIAQQPEEVLTGIVKKTARLIYRTYNYEWQTILKIQKSNSLLELTKSQINILAERDNGYVYNSGDDRYNGSEPKKTKGMIVMNADHLLKLMAGPNVHELSCNIDMTFRGSGEVWDTHKKKQGWNKSPTTLFVALVLQVFRKLEISITEENLGNMVVNPFETRNLAAHLGEYYTNRGSHSDPAIVFYTMPSRQRHLRIALPVRIIPLFGNLLLQTPPTKKTRIEGSRGVVSRTNRGRDEFHILFATIEEQLPKSQGGTKVSIIDILIMRIAWLKIAQMGHDMVQTNIQAPQSFCNIIATALVNHHDPILKFFDAYSKFNAKWKSWRTSGIKMETILQEPLKEWGRRVGLSPSFLALFRRAISTRRWETYRSRLENRNVHDGQTKIPLPPIGVLQDRIMGNDQMTHGKRLEEFGRTGDITSDLFLFLVQIRQKWVKLRDEYYDEETTDSDRLRIAGELMKLIKAHSPVKGEWNRSKLISLVLERKSCRGKN